MEQDNKKESESKNSSMLSKNGEFSPCCGYYLDCIPSTCAKLNEWLMI